MNHPPPDTNPQDLEYIDTQIKATEDKIAACDALILSGHDQRTHHQAQLVQLKRIRHQLRDATPATWWDTVLIEDLVAGDVVRFERSDGEHAMVAVNRNRDGRIVLRTDAGVGLYDGDTAVRVRFPRPVATALAVVPVVLDDDLTGAVAR